MRPMGTVAYRGKGQGKGKGRGEGRLGQGGRGRSKGGEKLMGTTAYGGKGSKGRAANGDRPVGAASCRRDHHTMASCQNPPPPVGPSVIQRRNTGCMPSLLLPEERCLRSLLGHWRAILLSRARALSSAVFLLEGVGGWGGRLWTACGQRRVDSRNSQTTPPTTSTSSIRKLLGAADVQTAHPAASSTAPTHQTTGLCERGNDTSKSTGRSGRQKVATRRNMRREERVTVQGPVKEQQRDGMSHRG